MFASATNLPAATLAGIVAYELTDATVRWEREIGGFDTYPSTPPVLADSPVFYVNNESSGVVAVGNLPLTDDESMSKDPGDHTRRAFHRIGSQVSDFHLVFQRIS